MGRTNRKTAIADEFRIYRTESGETDITSKLGEIELAGVTMEMPVQESGSVGKVPDLQTLIDQVVSIETRLHLKIPNFKVFRLMGTYNEYDDSGDGTDDSWEIQLDDYLPEHKMEMVVAERASSDSLSTKDDKTLVTTGIKWGQGQVRLTRDGAVRVQFTGQATGIKVEDKTITTPDPDDEPASWLDSVAYLDGSDLGAVESFTWTYDRNIEPLRDVTKVNSGKLMPVEIKEGMKNFSYQAVTRITDTAQFEASMDDTSFPLEIADSRSTKPFKFDLGNQPNGKAGYVETTGAKITNQAQDLEDNDDVRTIDIEGSGTKATIEGDL